MLNVSKVFIFTMLVCTPFIPFVIPVITFWIMHWYILLMMGPLMCKGTHQGSANSSSPFGPGGVERWKKAQILYFS
jgi:hypothetical protein